jgi:hypothetical protein
MKGGGSFQQFKSKNDLNSCLITARVLDRYFLQMVLNLETSKVTEATQVRTSTVRQQSNGDHLLGQKGVEFSEFLAAGTTINTDRYC